MAAAGEGTGTPFDEVAANRLVAQAFGPSSRLAGWDLIEPWAVARLRLDRAPLDTAILKWVRQNPQGFRTDPVQLRTESAALAFMAQVAPQLAPLSWAVDLEAGLLLLEDLSPRRPLLDLVVEDPGARSGILEFSEDLARLHAQTLGRSSQYYDSRRSLGPVDPDQELRRFFLETAWSVQDIASFLDEPLTGPAESDLARAMRELTEPGAFLAFSNGDCGINNYLVGEQGGRMIDFEFAGYRHCLSDLACLYVPGPQWMAVGDPLLDGTELGYRSILAPKLPEVEDDSAYGRGISSAGLLYALTRLSRLPVLDARPIGHESRRQMVSTLAAAHRTAERFRALLGLRSWVELLSDALRNRWPDADIDPEALEPYSRRL